jgi:ABC-type transport system involved in multi-copper enzyme maturation permease subunit
MKILAIIAITVRESLSRFSFTAFFAASTLLILVLLFAFSQGPVQGGLSMIKVFGATHQIEGAPQDWVGSFYRAIMAALYSLGIFLALFATADLLPNLQKKGTIDLLLSKPLSRTQIYLANYLGGLTVVGANILYLVGGVWLVLSWKTGVWPPGFLVGGILTLVMFAIILTFTCFIGLISRSGPLSLILAYTIIFTSGALHSLHRLVRTDALYSWIDNPVTRAIIRAVVEFLYRFLPRFFEAGNAIFSLSAGKEGASITPVLASLPFAAAFLALGLIVFNRRDF